MNIWTLTYTTKQDNRVNCLTQTGFAAFVKGVEHNNESPFTENEKFPDLLDKVIYLPYHDYKCPKFNSGGRGEVIAYP